jgi:hypothetical protein
MTHPESLVRVVRYIDKRKREKFTGGIKISFDSGLLNSFSERGVIDERMLPVKQDFDLAERIKEVWQSDLSGSFFLALEDGALKGFSFVRTWNGAVAIKRLLDGCQP